MQNIYDILMANNFYLQIPVVDERNGNWENSNGGAYVCRDEFISPCPGSYFCREVWSLHGDLADFPKWEKLTCSEWFRFIRESLRRNANLPDDLKI